MRFFKYLNLTEDEIDSLPTDIKQGGELIDGLQLIYEEMPEGSKKDMFASVIAESASILITKINEIVNGYDAKAKMEEEMREMEKEEEVAEEVKEQVVEEFQMVEPDEKTTDENPVKDTDVDKVDPPIESTPSPKPKTTQPQTPTEMSEEDKLLEHLKIAIENLEF